MTHTTFYSEDNGRNHIELFKSSQIESRRLKGARMDGLELNCTVILMKVDAVGQ